MSRRQGQELIIEHSDAAAILSRAFARDTSLGWDARGVGVWLASHSTGYRLILASLPRQLRIGKTRWARIRAELRAAGYLQTSRSRTSDGRWLYRTSFCAWPRRRMKGGE